MEENREQMRNVLLLSMGEVDDGISYWYLLRFTIIDRFGMQRKR